jgi:hypothetical protein
MRHVMVAALLSLTLAAPAAADPAGPAVSAHPGKALDEDVGFRGCGSHAAVARWLAGNFAEKPLARGLQGDGRLFELFMAKDSGTWTVVVTDSSGESCIVTEGTSLELLPEGASGPVA